ncbi:putative histone RNA hairpin-binding protein [Monocercomonoides exilis]|uniref:putative histone RNA hairpin-binding protein n=1 Tax=Monocercomonoides exilis TaxID=2049356 RepID=UPI003559BE8B|nr:putative histone RNA hairpin-binding protein [Monocercomonoides exilis]|eukprot:MONOS_6102.1-p1 / transcript=MONOS_6102.1 / gene=MONOS_6102 / organism=Monocercomonoides_exilis_PA203 / gene_product=unspecified product / transcript_product=unspecified product / location=Mono_scaffold00188:16559-17883(+) / protein_length=420 / sequence_SO=supercontig / SO=protein_coding / is_pseudo=false
MFPNELQKLDCPSQDEMKVESKLEVQNSKFLKSSFQAQSNDKELDQVKSAFSSGYASQIFSTENEQNISHGSQPITAPLFPTPPTFTNFHSPPFTPPMQSSFESPFSPFSQHALFSPTFSPSLFFETHPSYPRSPPTYHNHIKQTTMFNSSFQQNLSNNCGYEDSGALFDDEDWSNPEKKKRRIEQREKQIIYGKSTSGYRNYVSAVKKDQRDPHIHPSTPKPEWNCSKRAFDSVVRSWRRYLHGWDDHNSEKYPYETTEVVSAEEMKKRSEILELMDEEMEKKEERINQSGKEESNISAFDQIKENVDEDEKPVDLAIIEKEEQMESEKKRLKTMQTTETNEECDVKQQKIALEKKETKPIVEEDKKLNAIIQKEETDASGIINGKKKKKKRSAKTTEKDNEWDKLLDETPDIDDWAAC